MKRDFLRLSDLSLEEASSVLALAKKLKRKPRGYPSALAGRAIAIVLEKSSTRTKVSFEVGVAQLGGYPAILQTQGSQMGRGEPLRDTARVLARYCDAIVFRTSTRERLTEMASASVPVINALTDDGHPVQVLCDVFSMEEAFEARGDRSGIKGKRIAFVGEGSGNMARSFIEAARLFDFQLALATPKGYEPPQDEIAAAGGNLSITNDPKEAVKGADAVHTDVWTSMGQEEEAAKRLRDFAGYTVTEDLLASTKESAPVFHCLPAHREEEIADAVIEGPRSRVFDQAENRLHVQKALLCFLLGAKI